MRKLISLIPVIIFFVTTGCEQYQKQNQEKDEQAIRNIILQMTDGFNKHDANAATEMYTSDADFVNVRGDKYTGAAEIRQKLAE